MEEEEGKSEKNLTPRSQREKKRGRDRLVVSRSISDYTDRRDGSPKLMKDSTDGEISQMDSRSTADSTYAESIQQGKIIDTQQIKQDYKKIRKRCLAVAASSLTVFPAKVISLITFISTTYGEVPGPRAVFFYVFTIVGALLCVLQAMFVFAHYYILNRMKNQDLKKLEMDGSFPRWQMGHKKSAYQLLYWVQICLISVYS